MYFSKPKFVNSVEPRFSGLKFIITWQISTPSGSILKNFVVYNLLYVLQMICKRILAKLNLWMKYNPGFSA